MIKEIEVFTIEKENFKKNMMLEEIKLSLEKRRPIIIGTKIQVEEIIKKLSYN